MFRLALCLTAALFASNAHARPYTGLALIPLAAPSFPKEKALEVLKASPRPTFAFVNAAFGNSPKNIHWLIDGLVSDPLVNATPLRVSFYLSCGPCRPPRRTGPLALARFRPDLSIVQLNGLLERQDRKVMSDWRRWVKRARARFIDPRPNVEWRIFVELEDNLTDKAYRVMLASARKSLKGLPMLHFARNRFGAPSSATGRPIEVHTYGITDQLRRGDAINGDGETRDPTQREYDQMSQVDFLLWRAEWQMPNTPLRDRVYRMTDIKCLKRAMRRKAC